MPFDISLAIECLFPPPSLPLHGMDIACQKLLGHEERWLLCNFEPIRHLSLFCYCNKSFVLPCVEQKILNTWLDFPNPSQWSSKETRSWLCKCHWMNVLPFKEWDIWIQFAPWLDSAIPRLNCISKTTKNSFVKTADLRPESCLGLAQSNCGVVIFRRCKNGPCRGFKESRQDCQQ